MCMDLSCGSSPQIKIQIEQISILRYSALGEKLNKDWLENSFAYTV